MATFVLVHGAFHGGWCWDEVRGLLETAGHTVATPDLPSQGDDQTPLAGITLDSYVNRVVEALDAQPEPVVLAGHSLGGVSISQAAERRPDKVHTLVYVAAFLLPNGSSPRKFYEDQGIPSPVISKCHISEDGVITYPSEYVAEQILNTSPQAAVDRTIEKLRPMSRRPLGTPLRLSEENFGRVPRVYFAALQDNSIPFEYQRRMYEAMPCQKVVTFDTDHSPMASAPQQLVEELLKLTH